MNDTQPKVDELRRAYAERPFSIFAVKRWTRQPGEVTEHRTSRSALIFPVGGRARITVGDAVFEGTRGTVLHVYPNQPLRFEVLGRRPFENLNVYYEAGENAGTDVQGWMDRPWTFSPKGYEVILSRVESLEALGEQPSLENHLNQIIGATGLLKSMFDTTPHLRANEQVACVRSYIEAHCAEPMTLGDLAHIAGMTEQRLSYRFNKAYGMRPMNYLIERRLERADELLREGLLVKEAAAAVGYDDALYFSRLFKKHRGVAPGSVRKAGAAETPRP